MTRLTAQIAPYAVARIPAAAIKVVVSRVKPERKSVMVVPH